MTKPVRKRSKAVKKLEAVYFSRHPNDEGNFGRSLISCSPAVLSVPRVAINVACPNGMRAQLATPEHSQSLDYTRKEK